MLTKEVQKYKNTGILAYVEQYICIRCFIYRLAFGYSSVSLRKLIFYKSFMTNLVNEDDTIHFRSMRFGKKN